MSTENIMDELETVEEAPESNSEPAAKKKVNGRLITSENARAYQMSSAAARKRRRETRHLLLNALTTKLNLGDELVKAVTERDEQYLGIIMSAAKLVGLEYNQSDEARIQNLKVDSNVNAKVDNRLELVFRDEKPREE